MIEEKIVMRFPIVIHKDEDSDYGVIVPDLAGCFSAGSSFEEALTNAVEAIECHVEGMLLDGESLPILQSIEQHQRNSEYNEGVWALVAVDLSKLSGKSKRVNITLPEHVLHQMDTFASSHGETRSGLIATAALEYMSNHD
jgi:predicted RNase H-like HicB family nuclease